MAKIKLLNDIQERLNLYLDPKIAKYCQVANLNNACLVIIAANGSVATQLRFQTYDLVQKFKQDNLLQVIKAIQCKVRPFHVTPRLPQKPARKMRPPSTKTAETILQIADAIEDPKLKEILKKIASQRNQLI